MKTSALIVKPARARAAGLALIGALVGLALTGCGSGAGPRKQPDPPKPPDPPPAYVPPNIPTTTQVVLICWDGAQRQHVREMMRDGRLPNLRRLASQGGFAATPVTGHASETLTGHIEILTGYGPSVTGVRSVRDERPIDAKLTVFYRLEQHFGPESFTTVWLSSKRHRMGGQPDEAWAETRKHIDVWDGDRNRSHRKTGPLALDYVQQYARPDAAFFIFLHFKEPDPKGHNYGENSPEYDQGLMDVDSWLGRIRGALESAGVASTAAVCVTTDHGFDEDQMTHKQAPDAWLATNWAPLVHGHQGDVAPTILSAYGLDLGKLTPLLPGRHLWRDTD